MKVKPMRRKFFVLAGLVLGVASVGCDTTSQSTITTSPASSQSVERKIAMISITSDPNEDLQEVNMGLTFAGFCADEGYDVNIFLNVKGVMLATNDFSDETRFQNHEPLKQQLIALKERGVNVHVCPVCMKDFDIDAGEIIPEAFVTDKPKLFAKLGSDTMVFTY